jgi:hypothetical protein
VNWEMKLSKLKETLSKLWKSSIPFLQLGFSALYFVLMYYVASLSVGHPLAISFLIAALGIALSVALVLARFTSIGRKLAEEIISEDWVGTTILTIFLIASSTAGFTSLSVGLYRLHIGMIKGGPLHGIQIVDAVYSSYLWHLLAAVPLLQIPSTLNWTLRHPFTDHIQGGLIVIYTLTDILPFLYVGSKMVRAWLQE